MLVIVACGESTKTVDGKELMTYQEKYPDGQIKMEYTYYLDEHGLESRQGELRKYASNGQLIRRSHFKDSKLDGLFEEFDDQDGRLRYKAIYKEGERVSEEYYD